MTALPHQFQNNLLDRLPRPRGRLIPNAQLDYQTWFRVGGPAEVMFKPADDQDLADFIKDCPADIPITVMGVASNMLVRDGGIPGVLIKLGGGFARIVVQENLIIAGAGALDLTIAQTAQKNALAGLEFLCGVPGTLGGGIGTNAGAYGGDLSEVIESVSAVTREGELVEMSNADLNFSYRHADVPKGLIFIRAKLKVRFDDPQLILERMMKISNERHKTQPIHTRTGGSTFMNPEGHKAWELIDQAGCRGLSIGDAHVSDLHCNFLVNKGQATAQDIEDLGEEVRRRVKLHSGVALEWEIRRIGVGLKNGEQNG